MEQFRIINSEESVVARKSIQRGRKPLPMCIDDPYATLEVVYLVDEDELWTKCVLRWHASGANYLTVGVAKRANYHGDPTLCDQPSDKGKEIAFYRALKAGFDDELIPL